MVEITYQMVLSTIQTLSVLVGIVYYLIIMRNTQKTRELTLQSQELARKAQEQAFETRQIQFCWQALERVYNKEFMRRVIEIMYHQDFKDYEEWREKYGPSTNPDAYVDYYQVTSTFQGLGYLVQSRVLDPEALSKYIRPRSIISLWEKVEPIVKVHRERLNPTAYDAFEHLANEMRTLLELRMEQARTHTE
jgi:hypothetical protein